MGSWIVRTTIALRNFLIDAGNDRTICSGFSNNLTVKCYGGTGSYNYACGGGLVLVQ
ncbi:MAG: hypothetical protein R2788_03600 [Saprospiraceae bacterium]